MKLFMIKLCTSNLFGCSFNEGASFILKLALWLFWVDKFFFLIFQKRIKMTTTKPIVNYKIELANLGHLIKFDQPIRGRLLKKCEHALLPTFDLSAVWYSYVIYKINPKYMLTIPSNNYTAKFLGASYLWKIYYCQVSSTKMCCIMRRYNKCKMNLIHYGVYDFVPQVFSLNYILNLIFCEVWFILYEEKSFKALRKFLLAFIFVISTQVCCKIIP